MSDDSHFDLVRMQMDQRIQQKQHSRLAESRGRRRRRVAAGLHRLANRLEG